MWLTWLFDYSTTSEILFECYKYIPILLCYAEDWLYSDFASHIALFLQTNRKTAFRIYYT